MKNIFSIVLLGLFLTTFVACDSDDETLVLNELAGEWNLHNISGGLMGTDIDYAPGDVSWTFNTTDSLLDVDNTMNMDSLEGMFTVFPTGQYSYQMIDSLEQIYINNSFDASILITGDTLRMDDGVAADGFLWIFTKVQN